MLNTKFSILMMIQMFLLLLVHLPSSSSYVQIYGINYSSGKGPDWDPNHCKQYDEIEKDLIALKPITKRIRIYSLTYCNQGKPILELARKHGFQVWIGLWVDNNPQTLINEQNLLKTFIQQGFIDSNILGIHVGSEAVYRKAITPEKAIESAKSTQDILTSHHISLPLSIADIGDIYIQYPQLAESVSAISANSFPYWEKIEPAKAVSYMLTRMQPVFNQLHGKPFILGETGWASGGYNVNASVSSLENQEIYFRHFYCEIHEKLQWAYYYYSAFDDEWIKRLPGKENDVEAHFGLFYADRTMKPWFKNFQSSCSTLATSTPTTAAPTTATPATSTPTTATPATSIPATATPATSTPTTATPATSTPTTATPATSTPATSTPTTAAPATSTPATSTPLAC